MTIAKLIGLQVILLLCFSIRFTDGQSGRFCGKYLINTLKKLCNHCYYDGRSKRTISNLLTNQDSHSLPGVRPEKVGPLPTSASDNFNEINRYDDAAISRLTFLRRFDQRFAARADPGIQRQHSNTMALRLGSDARDSNNAKRSSDTLSNVEQDAISNMCCIKQCSYNDLKSFCCDSEQSLSNSGT